jgi:hypothetical protein
VEQAQSALGKRGGRRRNGWCGKQQQPGKTQRS